MQGPVVGSSSTEKMLPHKRCQSFGQGGLLWLPSIGGIWDLFTCSTGAIEIPKTREKVSHALAIRPLKPTHSFHVDFLRRTKADLNGHRLVNLRWLESSAGFRPIETESEIDPVLRRGLHTGEGPPRGHQRHEGLARLDRDVPEAHGCLDYGIEDGAKLRTVRVLPVDEFIRGGGHEIRVTEPLHDEERLGIADHPLFRQPRAQALFVVQPLLLDPPIPGRDALPRPFLEEPFGHGPHPLPIPNFRHRRLAPEMLCRPNDNERQEDCSQPFDGGSETSGPTESRGGSANLQDLTDLRRDGVHDLPVRQSERPQAVEVALKELYVIPIGRIGRLHGSEWYEQTGCHGFGGPHVGLPKLIVAGAIVFANALVKLIDNPPTGTHQELIRAASPQGGVQPFRHLHPKIAVLGHPTPPQIPSFLLSYSSISRPIPMATTAPPRSASPRPIRTGFPSLVKSQVTRSMPRLTTAPRPRILNPILFRG